MINLCTQSVGIKVPPIIFLFFLFSTSLAQEKFSYQKRTDLTFADRVSLGTKYYQNHSRGKGNGYKQFERWKYWSNRNLDANGFVISKNQIKEEVENFRATHPTLRNASNPVLELGPKSATNTSTWSSHLGRLTDIAVQRNNFSHIIASAPSGGVWKTTNGGTNWTPIFDNMPIMDIYSVEMSHANQNHYFAGTDGAGIYRSTNGGASWVKATGVNTSDRIIDIKMHPSNASILYACGDRQGILYQSTNGGVSWQQADFGVPVYDIEFKPNDPSIVYIGLQGGAWVFDADLNQFFSLQSFPIAGAGAVMLAVTPANPNYLYALSEINGGLHGVFLNTNSGVGGWSPQITNQFGGNNILGININEFKGQAPRDMDIAVSPTNAAVVHVGGIETWISTNFGVNWVKSSSWLLGESEPFIHADCDQLQYVRIGNTSRLFAATDGGIFYSDNDAHSFTDLTPGIGTRQLYRIGISKTAIDRVSAGSQDNGSGIYRGNQWYDWLGADGMETFIDKNNANIIYGMIQFGAIFKSTNGGNTISPISGPPGDDNGSWVTPFEQDPNAANTVYAGYRQLHKSVNSGSWTDISNFSHIGNDTLLREVKIAPSNSNVIYAAFQQSMHKTTNGGSTWTPINFPTFFAQINFITVHPENANRLIVALSGASNGAKFYESTNGGSSWTNITSDLPNLGAQCAIYVGDPDDGIYVGMNPGLYFKNNSSSGWSNAGVNLPNVSVTELEIAHNNLYIATYGRGLWKKQISTGDVYTWTGNANTNWMNTGNWSTGVVPSAGSTVIIPDVVNDPIILNGHNALAHSISIEGGGRLTVQSGGILTVNTNVFTVNPAAQFIADLGSIVNISD